MRTLNPEVRGTGHRAERGREASGPRRGPERGLSRANRALAPGDPSGAGNVREKPSGAIRSNGSPGRPNYPSPTGK